MALVSDITGQAEALLKVSSTEIDLTGIEETMSITFVNKLNTEFFEEFYERRLLLPQYMKKEKGFEGVANTQSNGAVSSGAATFAVDDSSNFDASNGAGVFLGNNTFDIFEFAANSSNTFTTVTLIDFDHADDTRVKHLFKLPTDFGRPRPGKRRGDGVTVNGIPYYEVPELPSRYEFAIYDNGTSKWLWLPDGVTSGDIMMVYDKKPTTLSALTDTVDVPLQHDDYLVYGLVEKWKRILFQGADVSYEIAKKDEALMKAFATNTAGKRIRVGSHFGKRGTGGKSLLDYA